MNRYGAIEAGGTWISCATGPQSGPLDASVRLSTGAPAETLAAIIDFFRVQPPLTALGIGSFGPVDTHPDSDTWGHILHTPKPGWSHTDLAGPLQEALGLPVALTTDVLAAALGEYHYGAGQGSQRLLYLTVGTGIGAGLLRQGQLVHALAPPEMGHMRVSRDPAQDPFRGHCPYHGDCWEGLASGPALAARWGVPAGQLPADHAAWELEADYIAQGLHNLICAHRPDRILLGGGVFQQSSLLARVRERLRDYLGGYLPEPVLCPPGLDGEGALLGAIEWAAQCMEQKRTAPDTREGQ